METTSGADRAGSEEVATCLDRRGTVPRHGRRRRRSSARDNPQDPTDGVAGVDTGGDGDGPAGRAPRSRSPLGRGARGSSAAAAASSAAQAEARATRRERPDYESGLALVDWTFRASSAACAATYLGLVAACYAVVPPENMERMAGAERSAPMLAFFVLMVSALSKLLPILFRKGADRALSGVVVGGLTVQIIAMTSDLAMVFLPVPVMIDPVTGVRVHLLRWCEWTPLAYLMTFLTEGIDVPPNGMRGLTVPFLTALCQGLSTLCGLIFPFCPGWKSWSFMMTLSCLLFFVIFIRLQHKIQAFQTMKRGATVDEQELHNRSRLSLQLLYTCAIMWSILVFSYFVSSVAPAFVSNGSILKEPALTMVSESFMDVVMKVLYMDIIVEVHSAVFDDGERTQRRLGELRKMMSVVWGSSSDVIGISVRGMKGTATTMISPTYLSFYKRDCGGAQADRKSPSDHVEMEDLDDFKSRALVFEFSPEQFRRQGGARAPDIVSGQKCRHSTESLDCHSTGGGLSSLRGVDLSSFMPLLFSHQESSRHHAHSGSDGGPKCKEGSLSGEELSSLAGLLCRAWEADQDEVLLTHELKADGRPASIHCEAKVNRLDHNALIVVVRDTTERSRKFEAEKQFVSESTARQKDLEANRFTRHEVKNALLAAIGLCDSLKATFHKEFGGGCGAAESFSDPVAVGVGGDLADSAEQSCFESTRCINELDNTLHEVLDTVLTDAMARDVIHEVYEPRMETVDIITVLSGQARGYKARRDRFPIVTHPSPLPRFRFDPQLLRHIHRNAVSNACKYGKKGGTVRTEVLYDVSTGTLEINVINLPGERHDEILLLGDAARETIFSKGSRLLLHLGGDQGGGVWGLHSSGDGAWIMSKCAKTLGGNCDIRFEAHRTVFTLRCPATPSDDGAGGSSSSSSHKEFQIPPGTWGIAIDDSKIQRKLLGRFMITAGVDPEMCIVMGKDADETRAFVDFVVEFIDQHPDDYFFVIADENLDIVDEDSRVLTISGSMCIESIRKRLLNDQERRLLALVRSANASSHDVAIYNSRAHGFLPKAPMQRRDQVAEALAPLWERRFPLVATGRGGDRKVGNDTVSTSGGASAADKGVTVVDVVADNRVAAADEAEELLLAQQLMQTVEKIDSLCNQNDTMLSEKWPLIWKSLHSFKGDLLTIDDRSNMLSNAVDAINCLRGPTVPHDLIARWMVIRSLVVPSIKAH